MHSRTRDTHARAASWRWGPETAPRGETKTRQEGRKCPVVGHNSVGRKTGWIAREASHWPNPTVGRAIVIRFEGDRGKSQHEGGATAPRVGEPRDWWGRSTHEGWHSERLPHLLLPYRGLPLSLFLLSVGRHWQLYVRATVTIGMVMRASVQFVVLLWRFSFSFFFFFWLHIGSVPAVAFFVRYKEIESTLPLCISHLQLIRRVVTFWPVFALWRRMWSYNS